MIDCLLQYYIVVIRIASVVMVAFVVFVSHHGFPFCTEPCPLCSISLIIQVACSLNRVTRVYFQVGVSSFPFFGSPELADTSDRSQVNVDHRVPIALAYVFEFNR